MTHETQTPPSGGQAAPGTILGIVSLICGILGLTPTFGIILAVVGLVTGSIARKQASAANNDTGRTLGLIGMILSAITLVIALISLIFVGGVLMSLR